MIKSCKLLLICLLVTLPARDGFSQREPREIILSWDANPEQDLAGYRIYITETSGHYSDYIDVGLVTETELRLFLGKTYYVTLTAYDHAMNESPHSEELMVPLITPAITDFSPASGPVGTEVTISGTGFVGVREIMIGEASVNDFWVDSDFLIRLRVPPKAVTGLFRIANLAGTTVSGNDFNVVAPTTTVVLTPSDDAFVSSASPAENYGGVNDLRVKSGESVSSQRYRSYLKFDVAPSRGSVKKADLRLVVVSDAPPAGDIFVVSNNYADTSTPWSEHQLTWENSPTIAGRPVNSSGVTIAGDTITFDVTSAISDEAVYSFALASGAPVLTSYFSKESGVPPTLVLELENNHRSASRNVLHLPATASLINRRFSTSPSQFELIGSYPNPFNAETTIVYALPKAGHVQLTVYDLLGRVVRVLVDSRRIAGRHRARWSGLNQTGSLVGSGSYFVQLEVAGHSFVKKIVLLK